jgi:hypothetical protein
MAVRTSRFPSYARPAFLLTAITLSAISFPAPVYSLEYHRLEQTALTLARKAPRAVLIGGYWDTYVFVALQPHDPMIPVPAEGQVTRTPWTREAVAHADRIVFVSRRSSPGTPVPPPQSLSQYGSSFRLIEANWLDTRWYTFALYANERH